MKKIKFLFAEFFLCLLAVTSGCVNQQFQELLKSPGKYAGKEIEISGILRLRFEDALYLVDNDTPGEAVWLNVPGDFEDKLNGSDGHRIVLKDIFNPNDKGHLGQYTGSLEEIKLIETDSK